MLYPVSLLRLAVSRIRHHGFRMAFSRCAAVAIYRPFVVVGSLVRVVGWETRVPLYETYAGKSLQRITQDAYDRFFTRIEQRFSRREISSLHDTFSRVSISSGPPYWHFLCER
jgi:hypothetical protein